MSDTEKKKDELPEEETTPTEETGEVAQDAEPQVAKSEAVTDVDEDIDLEILTAKSAAVKPVEEKKISGFAKVEHITSGMLKTDIPGFRPGDTVKVHVKIIESNKERIQVFEGVVISMKHGGMDQTFTVRKTSWGVGVERTFFTNSPKVDRIEVVRRGHVRRAKLYFLRERAGKSARIRERRTNPQ